MPSLARTLLEAVIVSIGLLAPGVALAQRPDSQLVASPPARAARALIRPGDRIVVRVWREHELSDTAAMVNERAEVVIPRLGLVSVAEHTPVTLRDWLRGQYATFLRDPVVDVSVLRRVVVNGEVNKPGIYHVDVSTSLRDVIAQAGGIAPGGTWRSVVIVRGGEQIPVRNWTADESAVAELRSGDQVLVGRRGWLAQNALGIAGTAAALASIMISIASLRR